MKTVSDIIQATWNICSQSESVQLNKYIDAENLPTAKDGLCEYVSYIIHIILCESGCWLTLWLMYTHFPITQLVIQWTDNCFTPLSVIKSLPTSVFSAIIYFQISIRRNAHSVWNFYMNVFCTFNNKVAMFFFCSFPLLSAKSGNEHKTNDYCKQSNVFEDNNWAKRK